jgi:hypothetical protein
MLNTYRPVDYRTVTKTRDVIVGTEHSIQTPASGFKIDLIPKFNNLNMFSHQIFFIFNKCSILLYNSYCEYFDKNWGNWILKEKSSWEKAQLPFANINYITDQSKTFLTDFQETVFEKLRSKYEKKV